MHEHDNTEDALSALENAQMPGDCFHARANDLKAQWDSELASHPMGKV